MTSSQDGQHGQDVRPRSASPHPPNQSAAAANGADPVPYPDALTADSAATARPDTVDLGQNNQGQEGIRDEENAGVANNAPSGNPTSQIAEPQQQLQGGVTAPDANMPSTSMPMDVFQQQHMAQNYNHLIMALAQISANQGSPLPTVTPSQVSLPTPTNDTADPLAINNGLHPGGPSAAAGGQNLESFARIEFADSVFQMTTYAVIIGRDQRALEQARRDERRAEQHQRQIDENAALGLPPPSPPSHGNKGKFSKSYVSEEGGMLGPESNGEENSRPAKRRKTSTGGSDSKAVEQPPVAVEDDPAAQESKKDLISNRQYVSHTPGAAAVDLASLRPSPYHIPFVGIHSPGPGIASKTKAISREHLKIQFNQEKGVFEAIPLHRNGFFREEVHYSKEKVVLRSGDHLQIKDVDFVFVINGVEHGKTGAEEYFDEEEVSSKRYSEGGKEMSFDFESSRAGDLRDTSDEESEPEKAEARNEESGQEDGEEEEGNGAEEEEAEEEIIETVETDATGQVKPEPGLDLDLLQLPIPPRKRGPGRPPKNGIMSKREERLLKKQMQEAAKKKLPQPPPGEPPIKRKVGRPRKHPLPEDGGDRPEKRKYKPRKPKNEEGGEGSDAEKPVKEKRREKPKTPPLELKMEDFTEEQLQKPNKNYGVLIDEVLSEAPPEGLTLKQIYKRIQKRYPYYYFVVDTKGWESSVRHNLIGNDAFKKNEETHLWCRVPGIELDAGKKRKAASPDHTAAALYNYSAQYQAQMGHALPPGQQGMPGVPPGYPPGAMPPQRYPPNGQPYAAHQGSPSYAPPPGAPVHQGPPRPVFPSQVQGPAPTQLHGYGSPVAPRPQFAPQQTASYSSPYASKPPPGTSPAVPVGLPGTPQNAPGQPSPQPIQPAPQHTTTGVPPPGVPTPQPGTPAPTAALVATTAVPANAPRPGAAPVANGTPVPPKPAVDRSVVTFVRRFSTQVISQLERRTPRAEAIAMSVVNRSLGLAQESTVAGEEALEKIIFGVFQTYKTSYPKTVAAESTDPSALARAASGQFLDPQLVLVIMRFKANMTEILKTKLGAQKSEALVLSAIDRVLGFTDRSMMHTDSETERKEFAEAENVLIGGLQQRIDEYIMTAPANR